MADLVKYWVKQQASGTTTTANLPEHVELTQLAWKFSHLLMSGEGLPTIFLELPSLNWDLLQGYTSKLRERGLPTVIGHW